MLFLFFVFCCFIIFIFCYIMIFCCFLLIDFIFCCFLFQHFLYFAIFLYSAVFIWKFSILTFLLFSYFDILLFFLCNNFSVPICLSPFNIVSYFCFYFLRNATSVTRWLYYLFNFGPFLAVKLCSIALKFAKICSKFDQKLIKPSRNSWKTFKFLPKRWHLSKSGHTGCLIRGNLSSQDKC